MKVMLMMWSDGSYEGGDSAEDYAAWVAYQSTLTAEGVYVDSAQFADGEGLTVVPSLRAEGEAPAGSDRRESDAGASLVGYYLLDCADLEAAADYARRAPLHGWVELRAVADA